MIPGIVASGSLVQGGVPVATYDEYELRYFGSNDGPGDVLIRELTMATSHGGADITFGRPTSGSPGHYTPDEGPDKAINDNTGDWWQPRCSPAATGRVYFGITFASAVGVNEITMDPHPSFLTRTPKSMYIFGRNASGPWKFVEGYSGWTPNWTGLRTVSYEGISELATYSWTTSGGWSSDGNGTLTGASAADRAVQSGIFQIGSTYRIVLPYNKSDSNPGKIRILTEATVVLYLSGTLPIGPGVLDFTIVADGNDLRIEADTAVYNGTIGSGISVTEVV